MATKATLESANVALKAQLETLQAQIQTLMQAQATPAQKTAPAKPLVSRGYFKTQDATTGKWLDDTTRPCIIIALPGAKPRKCTPENFERELAMHDKLAAAYKALS